MASLADKALEYALTEAVHGGIKDPASCHIMVLGVGGAGNNTVNRLMESGVLGAECIAINTDMQHLNVVHADHKLMIGEKTTHGLGSGGDPKIGRAAIEESREKAKNLLSGADITFITAGLGGGTGTGAAPIVAEIARENGSIVVGVVTMPFKMERGRIEIAKLGLTEMRRACDTVIVVDNNKLMRLVPQLPLNDAFKIGDQVLANMVKGITETIAVPSLINVDFADFKTIIKKGGVAVAGIGESCAPNRAEEAVKNALSMPLLDIDYAGATGALIHVSGDEYMSIDEANRVGEIITEMMSDDALVIWGARINPKLSGVLRVTLVLTGVHSPHILSGYGSAAPQLYNMDGRAGPEKTLNIDLGLYQLESF